MLCPHAVLGVSDHWTGFSTGMWDWQLPAVAIAVAILTVLCYSPYNSSGPGFISTSPATTRSSRLRGAMRRNGASSPPVPPPPRPLDTGEEGEETNIKGGYVVNTVCERSPPHYSSCSSEHPHTELVGLGLRQLWNT